MDVGAHNHPGGPGLLRTTALSALPVVVVLLAAVFAHFAYVPLMGDFYVNVTAKAGIFVMLAVSLNIVNGFTGQFSIGHAGFLAVGGYVSGWITYYGSLMLLETPADPSAIFSALTGLYLLGTVAGGLAAACVGYLVGLPSLRLRGDYLAIVTLGFGEILRVVLTQTGDVLTSAEDVRAAGVWRSLGAVGGALGFGGVPWCNNLFFTTILCGLTLLVAYRLKRSSTGRAFLSVREDEIAARAMGINITRMKIRAFVISSALAGVAGSVYAHQPGNALVPAELNFQLSFDILIMVVLGGLGSITGAALAAIAVTVVNEGLKDPPAVWPYALVCTFLAVVVTMVRRDVRPRSMGRALGKTLLIGLVVWAVLEGIRTLAGAYAINLADYRMIIYALVLILVMILRPQGLLGLHEAWDIARLFVRRKEAA
ncbi:MAG: branched-chain amino acid ABC transporter permease [Phycisphaerales bacterium]